MFFFSFLIRKWVLFLVLWRNDFFVIRISFFLCFCTKNDVYGVLGESFWESWMRYFRMFFFVFFFFLHEQMSFEVIWWFECFPELRHEEAFNWTRQDLHPCHGENARRIDRCFSLWVGPWDLFFSTSILRDVFYVWIISNHHLRWKIAQNQNQIFCSGLFRSFEWWTIKEDFSTEQFKI